MYVLRMPTHNSITVGGTSVVLLPENVRRKYACISNSSATGIWLGFGAPAQIGYGIYIPPNGGAYEIDQDNLFPGVIYGISSGTSLVIGTLELQ